MVLFVWYRLLMGVCMYSIASGCLCVCVCVCVCVCLWITWVVVVVFVLIRWERMLCLCALDC